MKCKKPNTDQECTLTVFVNGYACEEYVLPHKSDFSTHQSDILECFVPVSDGDEITLHGFFHGSVLHGSFDLLVDGSYVGDKRIEGAKTGEVKLYERRRLGYSQVFDVPKPEGWTSIYPPTKVVEGSIVVKDLPEDDDLVEEVIDGMTEEDFNPALGLGTIAVKVCVNQKTEESYEDKYSDMHVRNWKYRENQSQSSGGIRPTHELCVNASDEIVHKNRQSKHRRHHEQLRFGKKVWATFIFYYRSQMAIQNAGCLGRPDKLQLLVNEDVEEFVRAAPTPKRKTPKSTDSPASSVPPLPVEDYGPVQRLEPIPQPATAAAPSTFKKKLLGQSLFKTQTSAAAAAVTATLRIESPDTLFIKQESPASEDMSPSPTVSRRRPTPALGGGFRISPQDGGDADNRTTPFHEANRRSQQSLNADNASEIVEDHFDEFANGEDIPTISPTDDGTLATAERRTSGHFSEMATEAASGVKQSGSARGRSLLEELYPPKRGISHDEIRSLARSDGSIPFDVLVTYCDNQQIDQDVGIRRIQEIAFKSGTTYILNRRPTPIVRPQVQKTPAVEQEEPQVIVDKLLRADGSPEMTVDAASPTIPIETETATFATRDINMTPNAPEASRSDKPVIIKMEPGTSTHRTTTYPTPNNIMSPLAPITPTTESSTPIPASTNKRPASVASLDRSREGTPSKKAKSTLKAQQAKLATLKAQHEEKERQKRDLREQQAREAEEERKREDELMRQIEEMERLNREDDEELEALRRVEDDEGDDEDDEE